MFNQVTAEIDAVNRASNVETYLTLNPPGIKFNIPGLNEQISKSLVVALRKNQVLIIKPPNVGDTHVS